MARLYGPSTKVLKGYWTLPKLLELNQARPILDTPRAAVQDACSTLESMARQPTQDFLLFLIGGSLFAAGIVIFTSQVMVGSEFQLGGWFGRGFGGSYRGGSGSFFGGLFGGGPSLGLGLVVIPFGAGIALLLAETYKRLGWFLVLASAAAVGAAILQSLIFSFRPTTLFSLAAIVFMVGGGGGLMFKALRRYPDEERKQGRSDLDDLRAELNHLRSRLDQGGKDSDPKN
jgi:hypothetical protein